jgi:hypothetical protein
VLYRTDSHPSCDVHRANCSSPRRSRGPARRGRGVRHLRTEAYPELGATEFKQALTITLASQPRKPIRIACTEAPQKNVRAGRGRVRRISLLTEEGAQ